MSALGQKRTWRKVKSMSAITPMADILRGERRVRKVPLADLCLSFDTTWNKVGDCRLNRVIF